MKAFESDLTSHCFEIKNEKYWVQPPASLTRPAAIVTAHDLRISRVLLSNKYQHHVLVMQSYMMAGLPGGHARAGHRSQEGYILCCCVSAQELPQYR